MNKEIKLQTVKFKPFDIALSENPSTGYTWDIKMTSGIKLIQSIYDQYPLNGQNGLIPGAGHTKRWLFVNTSEIPQKITFKYQRRWEPQPIKQITYYIYL